MANAEALGTLYLEKWTLKDKKTAKLKSDNSVTSTTNKSKKIAAQSTFSNELPSYQSLYF